MHESAVVSLPLNGVWLCRVFIHVTTVLMLYQHCVKPVLYFVVDELTFLSPLNHAVRVGVSLPKQGLLFTIILICLDLCERIVHYSHPGAHNTYT